MFGMAKIARLARLGAISVLFVAYAAAQTAVVFVADDKGNVGRIIAGQSSGIKVGSLTNSDFTPSQVIGLAYDSHQWYSSL
jgi:hypothetical protein